MKPTTVKLTKRGIVTLSLLATLISLPISYMLYINEYASRLAYNPNYNGNVGGEIFIPIGVYFLTHYILSLHNRRNKYNVH